MDLQLKKSIDNMDLPACCDLFDSSKNTSSENEQMKYAVERYLGIKALSYGNSNTSITDVNAFVEFVISLARSDVCSKTLTIQLLQDIFDVSTINRCEELFGILEMHIGIWKTPYFFDSCKNMILRMCNDLLKRLSRTIDTNFCGKILILLAKSLPLNEKSGLNLTGQFNTANLTIYDLEKKDHLDEVQPQTQIDDDMEVGEIRDNKDTNGQIPADHNLYTKFWELQKFFANPNLLFEMEQFKQFEDIISDVFTVFAVYKLEKPQRQHEHSPSRSKEEEANCLDDEPKEMSTEGRASHFTKKNFESNDYTMKEVATDLINGHNALAGHSNCHADKVSLVTERTFFAKYLTSQKLFSLQLADSQFRRYFLLQFLIVANYLTSKIKMKEQYELSSEQENGLKELMDKCYSLLRETYPHGAAFTDSIKKILYREKQWALWKSDGCIDLVSQLTIVDDKKFARRKINRYDPKITDLGNKELTRLWNIETNNVKACKDKRRKCIPDLKAFLEDALDEMDPEQQVEEQYQSMNDEKYQWMASRFLLLNSDQYISYVVQESTSKAPEKNSNAIAATLRKTMQLTAENISELKPRMEQIQKAISKKNEARQIEEARLAARTRELERRIKLEEEEQQAAAAQAAAAQIKKEASDLDVDTTATTSTTEIKKEKEEKLELDHHQHKEKNKEKDLRRAQTPTKKSTSTNDRQERRRSRTTEATSAHAMEEKDELVVPPKKRIKHEEESIATGKNSTNANNNNGTNNNNTLTVRSSNRKEKESSQQQQGRRESKISRDERTTRRENDRPKNNKRKIPATDERSQKHENVRKRDT